MKWDESESAGRCTLLMILIAWGLIIDVEWSWRVFLTSSWEWTEERKTLIITIYQISFCQALSDSHHWRLGLNSWDEIWLRVIVKGTTLRRRNMRHSSENSTRSYWLQRHNFGPAGRHRNLPFKQYYHKYSNMRLGTHAVKHVLPASPSLRLGPFRPPAQVGACVKFGFT